MRSPTLSGWLAAALALFVLQGAARSSDALALLAPHGFFDADRRARLASGAAIVDVLPGGGRDLAVFGSARTAADGGRLVAWARRIAELQRGPYMPQVVRFSATPRLSDLDRLVLDASDLDDIRRCRPGDCGLRLSTEEIDQLQQTSAAAGRRWRPAVQVAFRQIVLGRALTYLAAGHEATPPSVDGAAPERPDAEFDALASSLSDDALSPPHLTAYLQQYPRVRHADAETFLYWAVEELGAGKPIISITHVTIVRSSEPWLPEALVAAKQVFATHYLSASLSLTAITRRAGSDDRYLVYLRRSRADLLDGRFGAVVRRIVERRVRGEAPAALDRMRRRLEHGDPPPESIQADQPYASDDDD